MEQRNAFNDSRKHIKTIILSGITILCTRILICLSNFLFQNLLFRVKKLKNTPIYVKPQLSSDSGTCRISVLVGIRSDPGKPIDSVNVEFQLPPGVSSADLTSNHGTVNILSNKVCIHGTCKEDTIFFFFFLHEMNTP